MHLWEALDKSNCGKVKNTLRPLFTWTKWELIDCPDMNQYFFDNTWEPVIEKKKKIMYQGLVIWNPRNRYEITSTLFENMERLREHCGDSINYSAIRLLTEYPIEVEE